MGHTLARFPSRLQRRYSKVGGCNHQVSRKSLILWCGGLHKKHAKVLIIHSSLSIVLYGYPQSYPIDSLPLSGYSDGHDNNKKGGGYGIS